MTVPHRGHRASGASSHRFGLPWAPPWKALGVALCLWMLIAHVYGAFHSVRVRLLQEPLPARPAVSLPLAAAAQIAEPYLVLVYRVRNNGSAPVVIAAQIGDRVLRRSSIPPHASKRIDLSWPIAIALGVSPQLWLWLTAGGAPGAALLASYNRLAYGADDLEIHGYPKRIMSVFVAARAANTEVSLLPTTKVCPSWKSLDASPRSL